MHPVLAAGIWQAWRGTREQLSEVCAASSCPGCGAHRCRSLEGDGWVVSLALCSWYMGLGHRRVPFGHRSGRHSLWLCREQRTGRGQQFSNSLVIFVWYTLKAIPFSELRSYYLLKIRPISAFTMHRSQTSCVFYQSLAWEMSLETFVKDSCLQGYLLMCS